jgi:hypothetical protein
MCTCIKKKKNRFEKNSTARLTKKGEIVRSFGNHRGEQVQFNAPARR